MNKSSQYTKLVINEQQKLNEGDVIYFKRKTVVGNPNAIAVLLSPDEENSQIGFVKCFQKSDEIVDDPDLNGENDYSIMLEEELIESFPELKDGKIAKASIEKKLNLAYPFKGNYIAFVDVNQFKQEKGSRNMEKKYNFKVNGSLRMYKAKNAVIKTFKANGGFVDIDITLGSEEDFGLLLTFEDKKLDDAGEVLKAGVINPKSNNGIQELKDILKVVPSIKGHLMSATDTTYDIEVRVDSEMLEAGRKGIPIVQISDIKKDIVKAGITTIENLNAIEQYLKNSDVTDKKIKEIMNTYKLYDENVQGYIPVQPKTVYVDEHRFVRSCVNYILAGPSNPLRFSGEAGTGKNLMVTTLAWLFQRPLFEKAVNSEIDKYDLLGAKTTELTLDNNGNQQTKIVFEIETFIQAMEVGGFCNLDEINTGHPGVLTLIHPVIDGRTYIDVPGYGRVVAAENFGIFSTMNYGYAGTQTLNKATKDRFTTILFPMNKSIFEILKGHDECQNASVETMRIADKLYKQMHLMVEQNELNEECLTVRGFIKAVRFSEDNGMKDSFIHNIANGIDEPEFRKAVMDHIDSLIR